MRHLLVLISLVPLAACAGTSVNIEDSAKPEPTVDVERVEPDAKPEPEPDSEPKIQPVVIRNQGFGPYDSLDLICGSGDARRCDMAEPAAMTNGSEIIAVASFSKGRDGLAHLAVQHRDGWYTSEDPATQGMGMLSHHSPASTWFDLKHARAAGKLGLVIDRRHGQSSFIGGMGNNGSSSFIEVRRLSCRIDGKLSCDEGKVLYSRACQTPMEGGPAKCHTTGTEPPPF